MTVFDSDGDWLRVYVAWGDGDTTDYGAFVSSNATVLFQHSYVAPGTFAVRARCHDLQPLFSDWSAPLLVVAARR